MTDPRSEAVRLELARVVRRWQQLPLHHASASVPQVRAAAVTLFELAGCTDALPELSPAATMDQLRVAAYDACTAGHDVAVGAELERLRRAID
jgi:hypothetical protein